MTAEELLEALETALKPKLASMACDVSVQGTEEDAMELLSTSPNRGRVLLLLRDEVLPDSREAQESGVGELVLQVLVQLPKGMALQRGAIDFKGGVANRAPLLTVCRWVRGYLSRCLAPGRSDFDNVEGIRWLDSRPYLPGGIPGLRTREMTFRVTVAMAMPDDEFIDLFPTP